MTPNEREFEQLARTHKATIYTVCYMFSKDQDEVADLYQECLITLIVFCGYFWEMHRVNRSIREIDELSAE